MVPSIDRRRFLAAAAGAAGLAGCGQDGETTESDGTATGGSPNAPTPTGTVPAPDEDLPDAVALEALVTGMELPVDVAVLDADHRYVADQAGLVYVLESGDRREERLLDLRNAIVRGYEQGVLGIAAHPEFPDDRRLFVRYSAPARPGTPDEYSHTFVLSSFAVDEDGLTADLGSERTVLEIPQPQANHNAGAIAFGPDGYLYVTVGDGGAANDQGTGHVEDWYDGVAGGNGQDVTENLLGSVLRIDVDSEPTTGPRRDDDGEDGGYAIPDDNPLVGREGLDEHYAWGLRNPWKLSFDGEDPYVADVGQDDREEVNLLEKGGNYGWNVREGHGCFRADDCPDAVPADARDEPFVDPIVTYPNARGRDVDDPVSGVSVIGGHVYRGTALEGLEGAYVFGDLEPEGRLFVATRPDEGDRWPTGVLEIDDGPGLDQLLSFGRDAEGELYVLGTGDEGGGIYRVVPAR